MFSMKKCVFSSSRWLCYREVIVQTFANEAQRGFFLD